MMENRAFNFAFPLACVCAGIVRAGSFSESSLCRNGYYAGRIVPEFKNLFEERLNTKLIYRTTRNMSLTEEGQHLYEVLVSGFGGKLMALKMSVILNLNLQGLVRNKFTPCCVRMLC